MNQPIDVAKFLADLADDTRLAAEVADMAAVEINARRGLCQARRRDGRHCQRYPVRGGAMCPSHRHLAPTPQVPAQAVDSPAREIREHTIDALIAAVTGTPAADIRQTLGAVLDELRASAFIVDFEKLERRLARDEIDDLERRLREFDGDQ